ncbi:MAG: phage virion morphogenesis protein [Bacteroidetes bacterium]|nr:phage virion morphogenesis protein [Bacteroidota bacterium]
MQTNLKIISQKFKAEMAILPYKVGVLMVAFSRDRFKYQNWTDEYPVNWQSRSRKKQWTNKGKSRNNNGRAILVQSGRLMRSVRIVNTTANSVTIGSDVPYAIAHNNGIRMRFTQHVNSFIRMNKRNDNYQAVAGKQFKNKTNIKFKKNASGVSAVKAHNREMNYKMPKRQFMGESKYLTMQINRLITATINKTFTS